jgi:hypothetical protein
MNFNQIKSRPFNSAADLCWPNNRKSLLSVKTRKYKNTIRCCCRLYNSFTRGHATPSNFWSVFHIHGRAHTRTHAHTHTHIHTHTQTHVYTHTHTHVHTQTYTAFTNVNYIDNCNNVHPNLINK